MIDYNEQNNPSYERPSIEEIKADRQKLKIKNNKMKHLFLPYELAVIAKEKGFNEDCLKYYDYDKTLKDPNMVTVGRCNNELFVDLCAAPLYQQITDWFLDSHNLDIVVYYSKGVNCFQYYITDIKSNRGINTCDKEYKTKYEALNAVIKEVLNIIQK